MTTLDEYIKLGEQGDDPYICAYLGTDTEGNHWFLDGVQGIEWKWEDDD